MSGLTRRALVVGAAVLVLVAGAMSLPQSAGAGEAGPAPKLAEEGHDHTAVGVAEQNRLDHHAHLTEMKAVARANGLQQANGGRCGQWFEVRTVAGLHCTKGPMLADMFTSEQLADASDPPAYAADPKVTCMGTGTDGKRFQMVYARRSNKADRYTATAVQMKGWAAGIDETFVLSAQKTGGIRKARWAHDANCVATVLNLTVPTTVTTFQQLVSALESQGLTSATRKYLVAWDDGDASSSFCGLGMSLPDSKVGSTNSNEVQAGGAMFAAVEPQCWTSDVMAHELMHTIGAVQADAPHATDYGHCTDESDIMCYADGPGSVMVQTCAAANEALYDCNNDDYFHTNPPAGNYLKTHWNAATSGWLDATGTVGPPLAPQDPEIEAGPGQVKVTWSAPANNGGSAVLAYVVTLSPGGRSVVVAAPTTSTTVTGLVDGTPVTASVAAVNVKGAGGANETGSATPSPLVDTLAVGDQFEYFEDIAAAPDGSVYLARYTSIEKVDPAGNRTTVVGGGSTWGENTLPLQTMVYPSALAVAPNGDLYYFDSDIAKVRRLAGGRVNSVAGSGTVGSSGDGGSALAAAIDVKAMAIGDDGAIYLLSRTNHTVRRFTVGGTISRVAGVNGVPTGSSAPLGDGGAATAAHLNSPGDVTVDRSTTPDTIYVADTYDHRVRAFTVGGTISTVAGNGETLIYPGSPLTATTTGVSFPSAIDWSLTKGLLIDTFGLIRRLSGGQLIHFAGDLFNGDASDADGTPAGSIYFSKNDSVASIAWSGSTFYVMGWGPNADATSTIGKLRAAGPWNTAGAPATVPGAPVKAPIATTGQQAATLTWVPASNGGSPITSYKITASPGGAVTTASAEATSIKVTGLTAGTAYTFTVAAVNAKGTGAASAASNSVTPTAAPGFAPFTSWSALIDRQHTDLVNRSATAAEISSWTTQLSSGAKTPGELDDSLRRGAENLANVDPVVRIYRAFLGRAPDAGGLQFWIKRKRNVAPAKTWTVTQIATEFTNSNEFKTKYGSLTNRAFVTRIYVDVLGRTADPAGVDYWTRQLDTKKKTKAQVMVGFSESNEYKTKQAQNTDVAVAYAYLLGRAPNSAEASDWVARQRAGTAHSVLLDELLDTAAYATRVTS